MATKTPARSAQTVLSAEFEWDNSASDAMVNTSGDSVAFGADDAELTTFDIIRLPVGSRVVGGAVDCIVASNSATTSTLDVGDSDDPDRYTSTIVDLAATAHVVPFTLPGALPKEYNGSQMIRATILNDGADTAGQVRVRVLYTVDGRASENIKG